jgi:hypothetical protein
MIYEDESLLWKLTKNAAWKVGGIYGTFYLIGRFMPIGSKSQTTPLQLYKTNEVHSNGWEVFRPVGEHPRTGKYGLLGTYYIFDGTQMYTTGKSYRDDYGTFDGEPEYPIFNYAIVGG